MEKKTKVLELSLTVIQILLAITLLWAAGMKWVKPLNELAAMWPWTGELSPVWVKLTGLVDLSGGLGLILPGLLRMKPQLTALAALGVVALMSSAVIFHLSRGEGSSIGFNIVVALLALFVAWGRRFRKPV